MKIYFLPTALITVLFTSCSTSYRTGQTPDDVYYSPARYQSDDVRRDDKNDDNTVYNSSSDDYEIRRRIRNRRYRRYDDRYNYPYGYNGVYVNPKTNQQNKQEPRKTNLGAYQNNNADTAKSSNPKMAMQKTDANSNGTNPVRTFNNNTSSKGTAVGNFIRRILSSDGSNSNNNSNAGNSTSTSRTFGNNNSNSSNSNNSGNSSNSGSKSSSSAPVRSFGKQN